MNSRICFAFSMAIHRALLIGRSTIMVASSIVIRGIMPVKLAKIVFKKQTIFGVFAIFAIQHAEKQVKESFLEAMRPLQTVCHEA